MCHDSQAPAGDTVSERGPSLSRPMSGVSRYARPRWRGGPVQQELETGYTATGARSSRP